MASNFSLTLVALYVLYSFVFDAPATAEPAAAPGPQDQGADRAMARRQRLLGLVRRILDYGRDLVATLQRQNTPSPSNAVALSFGTFNLALIIARIEQPPDHPIQIHSAQAAIALGG